MQQGKIQQSLKALWKEQPLFRAIERLHAFTVAAAFRWGVWDDSLQVQMEKSKFMRGKALCLGPFLSCLQFSTLVICIILTPKKLLSVTIE